MKKQQSKSGPRSERQPEKLSKAERLETWDLVKDMIEKGQLRPDPDSPYSPITLRDDPDTS